MTHNWVTLSCICGELLYQISLVSVNKPGENRVEGASFFFFF